MTATEKSQLQRKLHNQRVHHGHLTRQLRHLDPRSQQGEERREHLHDSETVIRYLERFLD
jgi:hypothetical protein